VASTEKPKAPQGRHASRLKHQGRGVNQGRLVDGRFGTSASRDYKLNGHRNKAESANNKSGFCLIISKEKCRIHM